MDALSASSLPPGFGFHPNDVELVSHYLKKKILGHKFEFEVIPSIDIYKHEPWDLPAKCHVPTRDGKWHFFASRDKKYPNGSRSKRATEAGYWKSTGKDRNIRLQNRVIGTKKTLVFHEGRPPTGKRTDWIMHEYYVNEKEFGVTLEMKDTYVLCRVTKRNGWEANSENVRAIVPLQIENVNEASVVVQEISSKSLETEEELNEWLDGLYDPNFTGSPIRSEVNSIATEGLSTLVVNQETVNSQFSPEVFEDSNLLFPLEEYYEMLQSEQHNFDGFGDFNFTNAGTFIDQQQEDIFDYLDKNQESTLNDDAGNNNQTVVQVRKREFREPKPPSMTSMTSSTARFKLQTNKVESRSNGESFSGIFEVNQDFRLNRIRSFRVNSETEVNKDYVGRKNYRSRQSSTIVTRFFLCAFMMAVVALICYFKMRSVLNFSALQL